MKDLYSSTQKWPFHPEFLTRYLKRKALKAISTHAKGILVDVGCGLMPFKDIFNDRVDKYFGVDYPLISSASTTLKGKALFQVITKGEKLPFKKESVDTFLLLDVLEHTPNPEVILGQMHRCLKSGGNVILTTPFLYPVHMEPFDFYRYTNYGMEKILNDKRFDVNMITPYGNFFHTGGLLLNNFLFFKFLKLNRIVKSDATLGEKLIRIFFLPLCLVICTCINTLSMFIGCFFPKSEGFTLGYVSIAEKATCGKID